MASQPKQKKEKKEEKKNLKNMIVIIDNLFIIYCFDSCID